MIDPWLKDGGPAFPLNLGGELPAYKGMSLRDYFAAQLAHGMISTGVDTRIISLLQIAKNAYDLADAMLAQRDHDK